MRSCPPHIELSRVLLGVVVDAGVVGIVVLGDDVALAKNTHEGGSAAVVLTRAQAEGTLESQ